MILYEQTSTGANLLNRIHEKMLKRKWLMLVKLLILTMCFVYAIKNQTYITNMLGFSKTSGELYETEYLSNKIPRANVNKKDSCFQNLSAEDLKLLKRDYKTSPVVVPKYKLIFFYNEKSACGYWKTILQRIQGIYHGYVHNATTSGLLYLLDFEDDDVAQMMKDTSWIKVVFVREPRERILSAFLEKGLADKFMLPHCKKTVREFPVFLDLIKHCHNVHWTSQVRLPKHFYKEMIIGKMSDINSFTESLLTKIGAWNSDIQNWLSTYRKKKNPRGHSTHAKEKLLRYYNYDLEDYIFSKFSVEYEVFGFEKKHMCSRN